MNIYQEVIRGAKCGVEYAEYKDIDKNIPIPPLNRVQWSAMEIGDSVLIHGKQSRVGSINQINAPMRFTSRKVADGCWRVWRVK